METLKRFVAQAAFNAIATWETLDRELRWKIISAALLVLMFVIIMAAV